jgi:hypothetical protein
MKTLLSHKQIGYYFSVTMLFLFFSMSGYAKATGEGNPEEKAKAKNIVFVHGAFADGSGYEKLYRILTKRATM